MMRAAFCHPAVGAGGTHDGHHRPVPCGIPCRKKRRRWLHHYRECVKRQLLLNGGERIHLSKNPLMSGCGRDPGHLSRCPYRRGDARPHRVHSQRAETGGSELARQGLAAGGLRSILRAPDRDLFRYLSPSTRSADPPPPHAPGGGRLPPAHHATARRGARRVPRPSTCRYPRPSTPTCRHRRSANGATAPVS